MSSLNKNKVTFKTNLCDYKSPSSCNTIINSNRVLQRIKSRTAPSNTTPNQFALLATDDDDSTNICVDSGATTTIVPLNFPLDQETATANGIRVRSCTGGIMVGKSKGNLNLNLPVRARQANKMKVNTPLLSVGQAADEGCVTVFTKEKVIICDENNIEIKLTSPPLVMGTRGRSGLWHVSQNTKHKNPILHSANSAYTQDTTQDLAMYLHACAGYPVVETWCQAIAQGNYRSWPHLSAATGPKFIRKHLPKSIATTMGHMKAIRSGTRSTRSKPSTPPPVVETVTDGDDNNPDLEPPRPHLETAQNHQVACGVVEVHQSEVKGLVSSDLPGRFPFTSNKGNNYIFVMYDFDTNSIIGKPIKSREAEQLVIGYQQCFDELREGNITPILHRLDNEVNTLLFAAITANKCKYQIATAHDHRQLLAERAIQTYKYHLISVLNGTDKDFPAYLWCSLLEQVNIQINLLRKSRIHPKRSAYAELHGHFDFNTTPLGILGTQAVIFEAVSQRPSSFADHGKEGWYIGPCMHKYRNYKVYVNATRAERESNRVDFFPTKCRIPLSTDATRLTAALTNLNLELTPQPATPSSNMTNHGTPLFKAVQALRSLIKPAITSAVDTLASILSPSTEPAVPPITGLTKSKTTRTAAGRPPRVSEVRGRYDVGTSLTKHWDGIPYTGKITSNSGRYYKVKYDDEDEEELSHREVTKHIQQANCVTYTDGWTNAYKGLIQEEDYRFHQAFNAVRDFEDKAFSITHPTTGKSLEYRDLRKDPQFQPAWDLSGANEFGRLAQGIGKNPDGSQRVKGTNTIHFIHRSKIPPGRIATYARFVCTFRPEKAEQNRTRLTVGGNLITDYTGETSTDTAGLELIKLHWLSVLSTKNAKYMTMDIGNFYLNTPLDRFEYMRINISDVPQEVINEYKLYENNLVTNGCVFVEIRRALFGLKQSGALANKQLSKVLGKEGYYHSKHTSGLWLHKTRDISFTLVVDDFGVKYTNKDDVLHLKSIIERAYPTTVDWTGNRFIGVNLDWNYKARTLKASMPGYVKKALLQFQHEDTKKQYGPSHYVAPTYGAKQQMTRIDTSQPMTPQEIKRLQQVCGKFLYYARTIDDTMMHSLNVLATRVSNGTLKTKGDMQHFLQYCKTNPNAVKLYRACDMILSIHSDAAYLVEPEARSRAGGFFYLGNTDGKLINGSILIIAKVIKNVVSSASEAEIAALFINARAALPLRIALEELGHMQPATKLITDNSTADGILNGTIKQNRSKGIDMRYYWLRDRVEQGQFSVQWEPGKFNLADYFTKHHPPTHHRALRPVYLFDPNCILDLQGCIKILSSRATSAITRSKSSPNFSPTTTKSGPDKSGPHSGHKRNIYTNIYAKSGPTLAQVLRELGLERMK